MLCACEIIKTIRVQILRCSVFCVCEIIQDDMCSNPEMQLCFLHGS